MKYMNTLRGRGAAKFSHYLGSRSRPSIIILDPTKNTRYWQLAVLAVLASISSNIRWIGSIAIARSFAYLLICLFGHLVIQSFDNLVIMSSYHSFVFNITTETKTIWHPPLLIAHALCIFLALLSN